MKFLFKSKTIIILVCKISDYILCMKENFNPYDKVSLMLMSEKLLISKNSKIMVIYIMDYRIL